jgi:hypothetical protein
MLGQVAAEAACWHALIGGLVPYIPDFAPAGSVESERRHLALDALNRQINFIQTLSLYEDAIFALRLVARPARQKLDLVLLARCLADSAEAAAQEVRRVWSAIEQNFPRGYPLETFNEAGSFVEAFQPFACEEVVEIRRHEKEITQQWDQWPARIQFPLTRPPEDFFAA